MLAAKEFYRSVKKALAGCADTLQEALEKYSDRSANDALPYSKNKELLEQLEWHQELINELQEALDWSNVPVTEETWYCYLGLRLGIVEVKVSVRAPVVTILETAHFGKSVYAEKGASYEIGRFQDGSMCIWVGGFYVYQDLQSVIEQVECKHVNALSELDRLEEKVEEQRKVVVHLADDLSRVKRKLMEIRCEVKGSE